MNLNDIGSSSSINGLCLSNHKQKHDHFITINHLKEKCTSNQLFKYILSDAALGIFNGKVRENIIKIIEHSSYDERRMFYSRVSIGNA